VPGAERESKVVFKSTKAKEREKERESARANARLYVCGRENERGSVSCVRPICPFPPWEGAETCNITKLPNNCGETQISHSVANSWADCNWAFICMRSVGEGGEKRKHLHLQLLNLVHEMRGAHFGSSTLYFGCNTLCLGCNTRRV